jgi:hypothetical protein
MKKTCKSVRVALVTSLVASLLCGWSATARAQEAAEPAAGATPSTMTPPTGEVARAVFARSIVAREPQDIVTALDANAEQVFFFTELVGMEGRTIRHRWEFGGQVMAEVPFTVGAPRWRAYSSKRLVPGQAGSWTVMVVDESGQVLRMESLDRALATAEPTSPTPPASPAP